MHIIGNNMIRDGYITSFNKKKDLIFKDWETGVLWSLDDGGNVVNTAWERTPKIKQQNINSNTKYVFNIISGSSSYTTIGFYDKNNNYISRTTNKTFITPKNARFVRISCKTNSTELKIIITNINTSGNLLVNADKYDPYVFKGTGDGSSEIFTFLTDMYAYLKKGEQYIFSCNVDGKWGSKAGEDTVEAWLFKDKKMVIDGHNNGGHFTKSGENIFTLTGDTGNYYIRIDNNSNNTTHTWSDFRISKVKEDKCIDFIGLEVGKLYKFGDKVENLIEFNVNDISSVRCSYSYNNNIKQYTLITSGTNGNAGLYKDYTKICKLGKIYTIGYKIKADNSATAILLLDNYNAWTNVKVFNYDITSNGRWIEIKQSFIATQENYRFVFGIKKDTTNITFYLKDMFLVEGDYTNKKIPDRLFK